jgi:ATP/maltotriose-dependent transcriptional regulator MalT
MDFRLLSTRTLMEYEVGDFAQGEAYLEQLQEVVRLTPSGPTSEYGYMTFVIPVIARISGKVDRLDEAGVAGEGILSSPSAYARSLQMARAGLALMAVLRGDVVAAEAQYSALESTRGTMAVLGLSYDRLLGLVAQTLGKLDEAMVHFEDALAFCRKGGYRPEEAWSACDYADALLQRNGPGDRKKAMSLLDEGLAISRELGMRPLMERILSRKDILKA